MTSDHGDGSYCAFGVRSIAHQDLVVGVGWHSSSGDSTEGRARSSLIEDVGDGGNGGNIGNKSRDVGRDFTAIRDEEREVGGEKDASISAICFSLDGDNGRVVVVVVVFSPPMSRRALRKASFSCFRSLSSSSVSARIRLSAATMLFALETAFKKKTRSKKKNVVYLFK